ncbi:MAG: PIN domain-containing protein [Chloroflexi bacterium]|nr:PIN domain-containing protein [Chloroflexota bacterium]
MRAVVDTNVWVSAILNPSGLPGAVLRALKDGRFTLDSCEHLLDEIEEVLARRSAHRGCTSWPS